MIQDADLQVINHHFSGRPVEKLQRVAMARKEVFHSFRERKLHIHHSAVAQSTMTKKLNRRRVAPTETKPKLPQSTWAHSPGANSNMRKAGLRTGRTNRTNSFKML